MNSENTADQIRDYLEELQYEWRVIYETRLGLLCGSDTPTPEQVAMAKAEADKAIEELREL